jgi:PAS domain S-box-containing protein
MADGILQQATVTDLQNSHVSKPPVSLVADIIIANAPDPVFVSDLEGKILQANDAVFALLGFRPDELIEQSLSRIISPEEAREFLAALRGVVERGVTRNARLNPRSASGEIIPTTLNASALRDADGSETLMPEAWMSTRSWRQTHAYVCRWRGWKSACARTRRGVVPSFIS